MRPADDPALTGAQIPFDISVMSVAIRCRHQDIDIVADHFSAVVPEQPLRCRTERMDLPSCVDDDDSIGDSVEDRAQPQLTLAPRQFGGLSIGDVADDPNKDGFPAVARLADGQVHRKHRPVFLPADNLAPNPNDPFAAGAQVFGQVGIMLAR
jgi:hypothetical protein